MDPSTLHLQLYEILKHYFWHLMSLIFMIWGFSLKMRKMPLRMSVPFVILAYFFAYFAASLWEFYRNL